MTIQELYDWACREGVEDCDLIVKDFDGWNTSYIEPYIVHHKYENGTEYNEVEL